MIYIVYTNKQCSEAQEILHFLTNKKNLSINSTNKNCYVLQSDSRIDQDAAIVLLSNIAVEDEKWQTIVQEIPEAVRIIPVSSTRNADYSDPELIPEKIREINYIRMDGKHLVNIWDSLITEKGFYDTKNMILSNRNVWLFSECSDDFLMTDRKMVKGYLLLFQKKMMTEENSYFQEELLEIIGYLKVSLRYAKKLWRKKITDYTKRICGVIAVLVCISAYVKIMDDTNRLKYTGTVLSINTTGEVAPINSVKLVDGITNPYISEPVKIELYNKLSDHLNMNWHNTPVGVNYKWAVNDAQIALDEQYIWTANGNGAVAKWDTYTGEIAMQEKISKNPLSALAVSERENLFVVVDSEGYVFKKHNGRGWEKSESSYDIPFRFGSSVLCNEDQDSAAVAGVNGKLFYFNLQSGFYLLWEGQYDKILCTEINSKGLEAVVQKDDSLYDLLIREDGIAEEMPIPIVRDSVCSADILNGVIVLADQHFQIVTWSREEPERINPAGIVLSRPYYLCFLNEQVIAYNDRDMGTHLYDLGRKLDLGSILKNTPAVSLLSASSNTVMAYCYADTVCQTENIEFLLPADQVKANEINAAYVGREVSLTEDDARHIFYLGNEPVSFTGEPTVTGITNNGKTLLVGNSDGSFIEIVITEEGDCLHGSQRQIPSHAAIIAIYQTEDLYYLEDVTGTLWKARIGYDTMTEEGAVAAVKERLHYAADDQIYDTVSKDTIRALGVKCMPGGGRVEWE